MDTTRFERIDVDVFGIHYKRTRTYNKWSSMIQRCTNPKHGAYKYYGAAGVQVHPDWLDFDTFFADLGHAPTNHWLDRIDNKLGYEPGNCRWVSPKQSAANRRPRGTVQVG